jgi:oligopeptide transport system substrate-binding protein
VLLLSGCAQPADDTNTLRRGAGGDPGTLDPALAQDEYAFNVLADLYEGLVAYGPDGTLRPGAAERWEVSADGLTWTFALRDGARWSDGEPVEADDFARSLARAQSPETAAPLGFLLDTVAAAVAVDQRTLRIELRTPMPHFLSVLALAIALPVREGGDIAEISNGAFRLDAWRPGELLRVVRNPHYHAASEVAFDAVEYYPINDPANELTRYRAGELDITMTVPIASLPRLRTEHAAELRIAPRLAVYYLALDLTEPPLDDPALRKRLSRAIDREALVALLGRGEQPAYGFVPDGLEGYTPARYDWQGEGATPTGIDPGITLLYDTGDIHEKIALAVSSMWQDALGIEVTLEKREWQYFLESRDLREDWDAMRFAWTGDYAHPGTFLDLFLTGGQMNLPGYESAEYDRLLAAGDYAAAESQLLDDYAVIPLYFYVSKHLVSPEIKGFEDNPLDVHPSRFLSR